MVTKQKNKQLRILALALFIVLLAAMGLLFWLVEKPLPNPYGPEDFAVTDGFLTCLSGESLPGIDVSHHQGQVRWQEVAASGVRFAMVRVGYRSVDSGAISADKYATKNLDGATDAGLKVGVYFYSQAVSVEEAREEADFVISLLNGRPLDMPVVFDWEIYGQEGRTSGVDGETLNECAIAFCEKIKAAGYAPMIYFNQDVANRLLDLAALQKRDYGLWLAMYKTEMDFPHRVDMWQYTETGSVSGIDGPVDLNVYLFYD